MESGKIYANIGKVFCTAPFGVVGPRSHRRRGWTCP